MKLGWEHARSLRSFESELEYSGFWTLRFVVPCLLVKNKHICPPDTYVLGSRETAVANIALFWVGGSKSRKTVVGRNQKQPVCNSWNDVAFGTRGRSSWNNHKLNRTKSANVSPYKTAVNLELDCWVVLIPLPLRVSCFSRYWQCLVFMLISYSCSCHKNAHVT